MRLLLANHHLDQRAGSELYCLELATALQRFGHEVGIFTFVAGAVADLARTRGITIYTPHDPGSIERFRPDVLHVQHAPCLFFLATLDISPATLFSSLGPNTPMEAAPPSTAGLSGLLAVSEEVLERQGLEAHGLPTWIVRNWFDDLDFQRGAVQPPRPAQRIAVITNHLDATLAGDLNALCGAAPGIDWHHFGVPTGSTEVNATLLSGYDRVVTIGRTVLLAGAMGIPCLIYDLHGSDGLLSAESLAHVARRNFSGRTFAARPSREELRRLLFEDALRVDTAAVADLIWSEYPLSRRAGELEQLYERALQGGVRFDAAARAQYGALGRVHADFIRELVILRRSHAKAWDTVQAVAAERDQFRSELLTLRRERAQVDAAG